MCVISVGWVKGTLLFVQDFPQEGTKTGIIIERLDRWILAQPGRFREVWRSRLCKVLLLTFRKLTNITEERARG